MDFDYSDGDAFERMSFIYKHRNSFMAPKPYSIIKQSCIQDDSNKVYPKIIIETPTYDGNISFMSKEEMGSRNRSFHQRDLLNKRYTYNLDEDYAFVEWLDIKELPFIQEYIYAGIISGTPMEYWMQSKVPNIIDFLRDSTFDEPCVVTNQNYRYKIALVPIHQDAFPGYVNIAGFAVSPIPQKNLTFYHPVLRLFLSILPPNNKELNSFINYPNIAVTKDVVGGSKLPLHFISSPLILMIADLYIRCNYAEYYFHLSLAKTDPKHEIHFHPNHNATSRAKGIDGIPTFGYNPIYLFGFPRLLFKADYLSVDIDAISQVEQTCLEVLVHMHDEGFRNRLFKASMRDNRCPGFTYHSKAGNKITVPALLHSSRISLVFIMLKGIFDESDMISPLKYNFYMSEKYTDEKTIKLKDLFHSPPDVVEIDTSSAAAIEYEYSEYVDRRMKLYQKPKERTVLYKHEIIASIDKKQIKDLKNITRSLGAKPFSNIPRRSQSNLPDYLLNNEKPKPKGDYRGKNKLKSRRA
jgi:hypothetical protein